jgi:hypothetical protein
VIDLIVSPHKENAMVQADAERALNYRNRAEQARAVAKETTNRDFCRRLQTLAAEFDSYAEDIERAAKRPQRPFWKLASA